MNPKNSYLLTLTASDSKILTKANINHYPFDTHNVYTINGADVAKAMELLKIELVSDPKPTQYLGILSLPTKNLASKFNAHEAIIFNDWCGNYSKDDIKEVTLTIAELLQKKVNLYSLHGEYHQPKTKDFNIFFYATPTPHTPKVNPTDSIYGIGYQTKEKTFHFSGLGRLLYDEQTGMVIAELIDDNLYILCDLLHRVNSSGLRVYKILIQKLFLMLVNNQEYSDTLNNHIITYQNSLWQQHTESEKSKQEKNGTDTWLHEQKLINRFVKDNFEINQKIQKMNIEIQVNKELYERTLASIKDTFSKINELEDVKKAYLADSEIITVITNPIHCYDPLSDQNKDLGKFKIIIHLHSGEINLENLSHKIDGFFPKMNGPHIDANGYPFDDGYLPQILNNLYNKNKFVDIVQVLLNFLQTANPNSVADKYLKNWPTVATTAS